MATGHAVTFRRWTPDGRPPERGDGSDRGFLLDRDGCLTVEAGHLAGPDALVPIDGAQTAVAALVDHGIRLAVITNQSAIARGVTDEPGMARMHSRLVELFPGVEVVYHCPHHADDQCACRKPSPVMPTAAVHDLGLAASRTWFVGDHLSDTSAAISTGLGTRLLLTGHGHDHRGDATDRAVTTAADLAEAVTHYLDDRNRR